MGIYESKIIEQKELSIIEKNNYYAQAIAELIEKKPVIERKRVSDHHRSWNKPTTNITIEQNTLAPKSADELFTKPKNLTLRPPKLNTTILQNTQQAPEFSPLSANSSNKGLALLQLALVLYENNYLPKWYEKCIELRDRESIRKHTLVIFNKIEELERNRLSAETYQYTTAAQTENKYLNRYPEILPFEHTRVKLNAQPDYINASFLSARNTLYIASQGPVPKSFGDFWQMVWDQKTPVIVMLTGLEENGQVKCHQYWPNNQGEFKRYHKVTDNNDISNCFKVFYTEHYELFDGAIEIREMAIKKEELLVNDDNIQLEIRRVRIIQFKSWTDHSSCDPRALLTIIDLANELKMQNDLIIHSDSSVDSDKLEIGPMVVHCSAGVGRSAVFCAVDSVLKQLQSNQIFQVTETSLPPGDLIAYTVNEFRKQRANSIQTHSQYQLCYDAVLLRLGDWFLQGLKCQWPIIEYDGEETTLEDTPKRFSWNLIGNT